jgi:4-amino-4-deoxy-L-arabinose transferase-like glycosyltransferase
MTMISYIKRYPYLSWFLIGGLAFLPNLGASHLFDWDEINFAESAREMIVSQDFLSVQINFLPFWEKPPLFIWLQAISFMLFGTFTEHAWTSMEFAARFPNAIVGISTLLIIYNIGKKHFSENLGHFWAFSYLAAITPHVYASSGIIDPLFNLFIFLGIYFFAEFYADSTRIKNAILAGVMIGLGMLTKGPVALLLWGLTLIVFSLLHRKEVLNRFFVLLRGATLSAVIASVFFVSWYGLIALKFGFGIIEDFFAYQIRLLTTGDAGHGQPFYYHALVLMLGCFPIAILALNRIFVKKESTDFASWMKVLFWVVLILFSLVKTKIVHYSSMCWLPISFFSAQVLVTWSDGSMLLSRLKVLLFVFFGLLLGLIFTLVPIIGENPSTFLPYIQDEFVQGNLQSPVAWDGFEKWIGVIWSALILYTVWGKNGLSFQKFLTCMVAGIMLIFAYTRYVVPKIEGYTQATPIDFYIAKLGQKVYIETVGFKSFAHLLYFQKQEGSPTGEELMNRSSVDRPTFFVMKSDAEDRFKYHPNLILIKEENGFIFYKHK